MCSSSRLCPYGDGNARYTGGHRGSPGLRERHF